MAITTSWGGAKDIVPPKVIGTNPQNGAQDVAPSTKEISVTFNERMMDKSWLWCYEERDTFPQVTANHITPKITQRMCYP